MTVQIPDKLFNDHPRVKLEGLHLYGVIIGDISLRYGWGERYAFTTLPELRSDLPRSSALWRGYVSTFRLHPDSRIELVSYDYMVALGKWRNHPIGEWLAGDFWLVFKRSFFGPRTYLPFLGGIVVEDEAAWIHEIKTDQHRKPNQ